MSKLLYMFDSVDNDIPADAQYMAGYVAGNWPTFHEPWFQAHRAKYKLSIAIHADEDADCLDCEAGDEWPIGTGIVTWVKRQQSRGVWRPVLYISASYVDELIGFLANHGVTRSSVKILSAHYGRGPHICGPSSCGECRDACDGTQYTSTAKSENLDESLVVADFFTFKKPDPHPEYKVLEPNQRKLKGASLRRISERGRIQTYDKFKALGDLGPGKHPDMAAVEHDCLLLFDRLWAIVHRGGVKTGSKQAKQRWSEYHRGERARILWNAAHGKR